MNALDLETLGALRERLSELVDDAEVRVVVLSGAGDRAFVAGADIKYMSGLSVLEAREWGGLGHRCAGLLETMPKPTIAGVNGFALGEARPAGDQPRDRPRLGRHAAARAGLRARRREGADPDRAAR